MKHKDDKYDFYADEPLPEGEEAPPPHVKTMAAVRWLILAAISLFALVMVLTFLGITPWAASQSAPTQYHCPMHPTYVSNQPGECPICGMNLVPVKGEGKTPDKGDSVLAGQTSPSLTDSAFVKAKPGQYTCSMCPQVVSDKPGECPICGMDLVPVKEPAAHSESGMAGETDGTAVPGLVSVTIAPERLQLIGVRTATVTRRALGEKLRLPGYVAADETRTSRIQVRVTGWVTKLFVDQTGQFVRTGEPLLELYSQELAQAQQNLVVARNAVAKPIADSTLSQMRWQLLNAARQKLMLLGLSAPEISELEESDSLKSELTLRSPFSGYVLEKSVAEGQYINPDQNLFTIADLSNVWVLADVYESDFPSVKLGQRAQLHLTSLPGDEFEGTVSFIYPSVSEKTRTLKVRLEFPNRSLRLRPGMYAEVEVEQENEPTLAVPAEAVMDEGTMQYAFVVHEGTHFEPRLLQLGMSSGDWREVISGLSEGEEVVTSANFLIDSESRLKAAITGLGGSQASEHTGHVH